MKLTDFKVLTFDVVGTLINFEAGVLGSVRRLGGSEGARPDRRPDLRTVHGGPREVPWPFQP